MKYLLFLLLTQDANAAWVGKLDLLDGRLPCPVGYRELHDGNWLAGLQKQIWHLEKDGKEAFHVSYFQAWRVFQSDPAYGLSLGIKTGDLGAALGEAVKVAAPRIYDKTKWLQKLSNWVEISAFAGARPVHGPDTHTFIYGIGGQVQIPIDLTEGL